MLRAPVSKYRNLCFRLAWGIFLAVVIICGTQVREDGIRDEGLNGGLGQLGAAAIRPYYQAKRVGFNKKKTLAASGKQKVGWFQLKKDLQLPQAVVAASGKRSCGE